MKMEHLGIMYLLSSLKSAGNLTYLLRRDIYNNDSFFYYVQQINPDYICYSVYSGSEKYYFDLDATIKNKLPNLNYITLYGGPAATFDPDIFQGKNYIRGEGENSILDFINGQKYKDLILIDINKIPFPDRKLIYSYPDIKNNPIKNMITRRGCKFNCSYCFNNRWNKLHKGQCKNIIRIRNVEDVINEALELKEKWQPLKMIHIMDDGFIKPIEWLKEFAILYKKKINLPFICNAHPNDITDEAAKILSSAGCAIISLALESANDENRKTILNRVGNKEQVKQAIQICNNYNIRTRLQNIIGLPIENSLSDAFETLDFNIKCKPTSSWSALLQCYKGSQIYLKAKKDGFIPDDDSVDDGFFGVSTLNLKKKILIERLHKLWPLITAYPKIFRPITPVLIRIPLPFKLYKYIFKITKKALSERDLWTVYK